MSIGGVSIILILGIINFVLLVFQFLSGMHWIRVSPAIHKKTGITLLASGTVHGVLAFLVSAL